MSITPEATAEALEKSIKHWEYNATATDVFETSIDGHDCALCNMFNKLFTQNSVCTGCPVYKQTGRRLCRGTPYGEASDMHKNWMSAAIHSEPEVKHRDAFHAAAQKQVEFLKSLRVTTSVEEQGGEA